MDKNVQRVMEKFEHRAKAGLLKYGVTTERTDLSFWQWLNHLQEELMDACVYIEKLKSDEETRQRILCPPCNPEATKQ
jgi:hypothetical protein